VDGDCGSTRPTVSTSTFNPKCSGPVGTTARSTSWFGLIAKANTRPAILDEINRDVVKVLGQPEVKARLFAMGIDAAGSSQKDFTAFLQQNAKEYGDIIRSAGIRAE